MHRIKYHQFSMISSGSRLYFDSAIALSTIIPLLSVGLLLAPAAGSIVISPAQYAIIFFGLVLTPAAGLAMLWRYPMIIMRLRTYLEGIIRGEIPDKVTLVACEADLASIEQAMNLIVDTLRQRLGRSEQEKARLEDELQQVRTLEAISTLAEGICQEINTPLEFIRLNISFIGTICGHLLEHGNDGDLAAKTVEGMPETESGLPGNPAELKTAVSDAARESEDGLDRISGIVLALRDFADRGNGKSRAALDVNAALLHAVELTRNEWKSVADLTTVLCPEHPVVFCFPGEIKHSMVNLLLNAIQAIRSRPLAGGKGNITVASRIEGDQIVLSVQDTGCGIPDHVRPRIFEPFFTTHPGGTNKGNGLSFVYSTVVSRHGGRVRCQSEAGQGTTMQLELPYARSVLAADDATGATASRLEQSINGGAYGQNKNIPDC